jgi:hypothetical protein
MGAKKVKSVKSLILAVIQLIYGSTEKNKQEILDLSQIDHQEIIISITDWKKFTEFASKNGDKTQEQMAQLWEGDISKRTISRALEKIGFTRKKRMHTPLAGLCPTR